MEFKEMTADQLIERRTQIAVDIESEDADLDALEEEVRAINAELETRKAEEAKKVEIREAVANGAGETTKKVVEEKHTMSNEEIRNSKQYIDAYAEYIKSGDDAEVRALLTENGSGSIPVPELVYDIVKTAWDKEGIMSRVRKAYIKGNLKVGFEMSSSGAVVHTEGQAVNEETLNLGIVTMVPATIKKWISVSDEVLDLRGSEFLEYVYSELAYQIAKKAADELVAKIVAAGTSATSTVVGLPSLTQATIAVGNIAAALGTLSDEAANPVVIMNKASWAAFKAAQYANGFNVDPFEGMEVVFNNSMKTFAAATTGGCYAIVGDLEQGALANFPNGENIQMKYDDMTLATSDLVRVIGRLPVALGVVGPNSFCRIVK